MTLEAHLKNNLMANGNDRIKIAKMRTPAKIWSLLSGLLVSRNQKDIPNTIELKIKTRLSVGVSIIASITF